MIICINYSIGDRLFHKHKPLGSLIYVNELLFSSQSNSCRYRSGRTEMISARWSQCMHAFMGHNQLSEEASSLNLKDTSPTLSPSCPIPGASAGDGGRGREKGGAGLLLPASCSHIRTWIRIGFMACLWRESFWLREMVSKQRMAPAEDTIHGRTFSLDTLEITSSLESLFACRNKSPRPERVEAASMSVSSTEEM